MVSYRSQLHLQQVEGQNPVSRSKFEKQIRLLFLTSAHAVLATLVKFAALPSSSHGSHLLAQCLSPQFAELRASNTGHRQ